jgi:FkbM family methyltransferase
MRWKEPKNWEMPRGEEFYNRFKKRGELYSMTQPSWDKIKDHLLDTRVAIDIGAHIGTTVLRYANEFRQVEAFEPVYFDICKRNVGHLDNVNFYDYGISDKQRTATVAVGRNNSGATGVVEGTGKTIIPMKERREITCKPLDEFGFTEVDFIKIDVEGYNLPVLTGMKNTLKENNPILEIEFNNRCINKKECLKFLNDFGYKQYDTYHVDHYFKR